MKILRNKIFRVISLLQAAGLVLTFSGCLHDNPMETELQKAQQNNNVLQSDIGPIHILEIDSKLPLLKESSEETAFRSEQLINAAQGGEIAIDDTLAGHVKIDFKKSDLPKDTTIELRWLGAESSGSRTYDLEFLPHGTRFNNPVKVEISYRGADLTGVNESKLRIFYFNEQSRIWEDIGGIVDKENKIVTAYLNHFSRYALAWSK